ncbi:branched-chain amino acid ABC transporter substrate-binding protein [Trinickia soli]|uniref:Branched chain amino acid ABC transporter substrate-binding protein n=1 Tax=Trinickia soli TaxID=380675 RepID=A0A2N7VE64_9BURK|nr:branched-chain amino acid ABC transporter substrate-binding protein [Trinickia soli]KAA0086082.1 branched-chain amino acid ABC transporter substrate-binding protein [Paraburkholderia sp. T12-10]PMS15442.1 branched chain amino acid ABC transporter substrate-binding protein [Trinickia soli]CAB3718237.1 Leucine-, isoleucine-, valine-, threonine-, and alanine-binding protein [Trinickia soli]
MQHKMKTLAGATLVAAMSLVGTAQAQQAEQVKIGFAGPMTGAQAHYGTDFQNGVKLAIADMNATKPVIGGKQVEFVLDAADDQADPRTGTTVAQKLVDDGIKGMIGHFNSGTTIPASRIYANAGIPEVAMATAPEYTQQGFKTTFRMMTSDTQQGSVAGAYAVKNLGMKKIAIVDDRTAYGQGLADQFQKAAKAAGATIVKREFTNDKATDFKSILTNLKAAQPDLIYFGGADAQAAPMLKQMKTLGIKAPLMGGEMVHTPDFLKIAGDAADGSYSTLAGVPLEQMPGGKQYVEKYKKAFGTDVETYSPYAYDGTMALLTAMKKANSTDPAKYLPVLAKTSMPAVTTPNLQYDDKGDLKNGGITVYKAEGGKWIPLK